MPKIINNEQEVELREGEKIKDACKSFGVPFGCEKGVCGTCQLDVVE